MTVEPASACVVLILAMFVAFIVGHCLGMRVFYKEASKAQDKTMDVLNRHTRLLDAIDEMPAPLKGEAIAHLRKAGAFN